MKTYQNIFHGTIASLLVISGIGLVAALAMCIGVGAGMILGYPSGVLANLGVSVFVLGIAGALFGGGPEGESSRKGHPNKKRSTSAN